MKIIVKKSRFNILPDHFLRRAGYGFVNDRRASHVSYARRLGSGLYPRFHMYVEEDAETITFNLHLDQQKTTSSFNQSRHKGEYDGELVEQEVGRLKGLIVVMVKGG